MSTRLLETESYFGRGDACIALAISSLKVSRERTEGRALVCCMLRDEKPNRSSFASRTESEKTTVVPAQKLLMETFLTA